MADIEYLDAGFFEETSLLSLGQSVDALHDAFYHEPYIFLSMQILDDESGCSLRADEAITPAANKLRNLAADMRHGAISHDSQRRCCMSDDKIIVCDSCLMASCWQYIFPCDNARTAGIVEKTKAELSELKLEHPDYWRAK